MLGLTKRLQILFIATLFSSAVFAMVPYNNQGVVNRVIPELNQVIINNTVYELSPSAVIHHSESMANIFDQMQIGQPIGYLILETQPVVTPQQITDIWIIE